MPKTSQLPTHGQVADGDLLVVLRGMETGTAGLEGFRDQVLAELVDQFGDFDATFFPTVAEGVAAMAVGKLFYALAPNGSTSPDDGRDVTGEKRLYLRTNAAPYYQDKGDAGAPAMTFPRQLKAAGRIGAATIDAVEGRYLLDSLGAASNRQFLNIIGATDYSDDAAYAENTPGRLQQRSNKRHKNSFDPLDYGAIRGNLTGDPALDLQIAQENRRAFNEAAAAFIAALKALDFSARLVFPRGTFLMCTASQNGAHYIGGAKGWSSHGIVLDAGVWDDTILLGGIIDCEGCLIKRIENDPGSTGTAADSNDSSIIMMGQWDGTDIRGLLRMEGYQVDTQAEGTRGKTSGDNFQIAFGARNISINGLRGWKGTNATISINLNKRHWLSTSLTPVIGFDTRPAMQCDNIHIRRLTCLNGEHGAAAYGGSNIVIDHMTVDQKPYTYGGVAQAAYQQRGFYCLNAQVRIKSARFVGVNHVGLFVAVYDDSRSARDAAMTVDTLDVNFPTTQDDDPDRYAAVEMQNANNGIGVLRTMSVAIGTLRVNNQKSTVVWRESNRYVSVTHQVLTSLTIDRVVGKSILHGIYVKPHGGWGKIVIRGIQIDVRTRTEVSTTVFPGDGLLFQAGAWFNAEVAETVTMAQMNEAPFAYWDGVSAIRPYGYVKPGNIKRCSDFPGAVGTVKIIYDPTIYSGAGQAGGVPVWGFDTVTGAPWKILTETPARSGSLWLEGEVSSECAPLRVAGVDEYYGDLVAKYIEGGLAILPADKVPDSLVGIGNILKNQLRTSADPVITDPVLARVARMADIVGKQVSSANLTAIAALAPAANKISYWTGPTTAALADFPAQARTFNAATTQAAQRSALGLGDVSLQSPGAVAFTGGAVTGLTSFSLAPVAGSANLVVSAVTGQTASMSLRTDGIETWRFERATSGAFALRRFDAAGVLTGTVMTADNPTGVVTITALSSPSVTGTGSGTTPIAAVRTGSAANCSYSANTTAGTVYFGNVDGTKFGVGASASLSTAPFFTVNATTFVIGATTETTFASVGRPVTDNVSSWGTASFRWSTIYAGTGTINTSDARLKRDIIAIPDALLDAWAAVQWRQFRYIDAYERKGEDARYHHGLVAQEVRDAIDAEMGEGAALRLGLLCYDQWEAKPAVVLPVMGQRTVTRQVTEIVTKYRTETIMEKVEAATEDGETITISIPKNYEIGHDEEVTIEVEEVEEYDTGQTYEAEPALEAGDRWGLRMEYCQAIEAAWQRREIDRDRDERAALEERIAALEGGS